MYLHLGQDVAVPFCDVVAIFDLENTTLDQSSRAFLANATKQGRVINVSDEMPKSFVVCKAGKQEEKVYISQISAQTLKKRAMGDPYPDNFLG